MGPRCGRGEVLAAEDETTRDAHYLRHHQRQRGLWLMDQHTCREAEVEPPISKGKFSAVAATALTSGTRSLSRVSASWLTSTPYASPGKMWSDPLQVRARVAADLEDTPDRVLREQRVPERLPPGPGLGVALRVGVTEVAAPQALESAASGFGARITRMAAPPMGEPSARSPPGVLNRRRHSDLSFAR